MENFFSSYYQLVTRIDQLTEKLFKLHKNHIQCKKGCDLCCMDYRIFPVEYYAIREQLRMQNRPETRPQETDEDCVFLKDHGCAIYENRPIICRTHGLPLLYMNDESWELSTCELNFTNFNDDDFSDENTYPQDKFNSELFQLNKRFIATFKEKKFSEFDLIPIKELASEI